MTSCPRARSACRSAPASGGKKIDFPRARPQNEPMSFLERLSRSNIVKTTLTLIVYAFYGGVLGASLIPSVLLVLWAFRRFLAVSVLAGALPGAWGLVL